MEKRQVSLEVDELKIVGEVYLPNGKGVHPALCLCHGIPAKLPDPNDRGYPLLAEKFCAADFVTMVFNFRGAGESEGNIDLPGWSRDLGAAIDFLLSLPAVDKTHLSLLGSSGGAAVCIYVAAHDPRISAVITWACPAEFSFLTQRQQAKALIEHFHSIGLIREQDFPPSVEEWLEGFRQLNPLSWIDMISPRPLLLVHGKEDDVVPVNHAQALYEKAGEPKDLALIPKAEHRLRLDERALIITQEWLRTTFMGGPE